MLLCAATQLIETARLLVYDGQRDPARSVLQQLRACDDIYGLPLLIAELQLAEGLLHLLDGNWNAASDRFRRAEVLARVAGSADVVGHAQTMLAHCYFNLGDLRKSAEGVVATVEVVPRGRIEFRHRFCLVVGQLYAYAGDLGLAREWFDTARQLAGSMRSRGLFSATIFNQFALQAWRGLLISRLDQIDDSARDVDSSIVIDAATNYDNLTGVSHRTELNQLLRVQVLGAQGQYLEALDALDDIRTEASGLGSSGVYRLQLERAWNKYHLAKNDTDYEVVQLLLEGSFSNLVDDDDLALAHLLMARVALARGKGAEYMVHSEAASHYRSELKSKEETVRSVLGSVVLPSPSIVGQTWEKP